VLQSEAWLQPGAAETAYRRSVVRCSARLPLYHIFALTICYLLAVRVGGVNLLIPNPRDNRRFIKELQKYQANWFPAVNTLYNALLQHPSSRRLTFPSSKSVWAAAWRCKDGSLKLG